MPHTHKSKSKSARADGGCVHCCVAGCAELRARNLLFSSLNFFSPECPEIACRVHRGGGEQAHQERTATIRTSKRRIDRRASAPRQSRLLESDVLEEGAHHALQEESHFHVLFEVLRSGCRSLRLLERQIHAEPWRIAAKVRRALRHKRRVAERFHIQNRRCVRCK